MRILIGEPIVLLLSLYMAFIYGLLYLSLTSYPIVFEGVHGFTPGIAGLCYFGMIIGQILAGLSVILTQPLYTKKLKANGGVTVPEWRLPSVMVGGILFSVGLFWFGWSGYRQDIHWIAPTLSGLFTGFGLMAIFLQSLNYIIDAYLMLYVSPLHSKPSTNLQQRGFCYCCQYFSPLFGWRHLSPVRPVHVCRHWR